MVGLARPLDNLDEEIKDLLTERDDGRVDVLDKGPEDLSSLLHKVDISRVERVFLGELFPEVVLHLAVVSLTQQL